MTENDEYEFINSLVKNRNNIQDALFRVYELFNNGKLDRASKTGQLLVGIGFCLWRAVFLAKSTRDFNTAGSDAMEFLKHLMRTNAVSFSTEDKYSEWTFGFYLGGAQYRIYHLDELLRTTVGQRGLAELAKKIKDDDLVDGRHMASWEIALQAFEQAILLCTNES